MVSTVGWSQHKYWFQSFKRSTWIVISLCKSKKKNIATSKWYNHARRINGGVYMCTHVAAMYSSRHPQYILIQIPDWYAPNDVHINIYTLPTWTWSCYHDTLATFWPSHSFTLRTRNTRHATRNTRRWCVGPIKCIKIWEIPKHICEGTRSVQRLITHDFDITSISCPHQSNHLCTYSQDAYIIHNHLHNRISDIYDNTQYIIL